MGVDLEVYSENGLWIITFFWSEIGSGFEEPGGTPKPRILRSTPPPRVQLQVEPTWMPLISIIIIAVKQETIMIFYCIT